MKNFQTSGTYCGALYRKVCSFAGRIGIGGNISPANRIHKSR